MLDEVKAAPVTTSTTSTRGARIRAVEPRDFDAICDLVGRHFDRLTRDEWQRLFKYQWTGSSSNHGLVIDAQGSIVGFVGMLYSDRIIDGRVERFCNLTSLCVDSAYRAMTPLLIMASARQRDTTITCLTPCPIVCKIMEKAGLTLLDTERMFIPPVANLRGLARGFLRFETDPARIRPQLDEAQRQILDDHLPYGCVPVLARRGDRRCLLIVKRRKRFNVPVSEILHASDPDFLSDHIEAIGWRLMPLQKTLLISCSRRLFGKAVPLGYGLKRKGFFRSRTVTREHIDNLYSEIVVLPI
ncbi:hypothetical protein [Azospirillum sp. sgz302134]